MKKTLTLLLASTAIGFGVPAFAAEESAQIESKVEQKKDGGYESTVTSKHKTPEGTAESTKTVVDVDVDADGSISKEVKSEKVVDPKGLLNTQKHVVETKVEEKDRGGYEKTMEEKKTNPDGTNIIEKTKVEVDVDAKGNVEEEVKTETVVDPEGLMNKTKTVTEVKRVNGKVVESDTKVDN